MEEIQNTGNNTKKTIGSLIFALFISGTGTALSAWAIHKKVKKLEKELNNIRDEIKSSKSHIASMTDEANELHEIINQRHLSTIERADDLQAQIIAIKKARNNASTKKAAPAKQASTTEKATDISETSKE